VGLEALTDLQTPWCVHVVATLRIAERIAGGVDEIEALAAATGSDRRALHNVLGHLATKGVFREPEPGRFELDELGRRLIGDDRFLDLEGIGGRMAYVWATLPAYVRTGRSAYAEQFGLPFWEDLAAHPEVAASFDALMGPAGHGVPDARIELSGGWQQVATVVDVGGGTGAMLAQILRLHPHVRGILVDLPATVARADAEFVEAGVADRAESVGQSFFDPLPAGGDVYLLKKVLGDWPDEETVAILARCAEACDPEGVVVVVGGVDPDGAPRRLSVDMVLAGGVTSAIGEFEPLAQRAGLEVIAAGRQPVGFVVECRPGRGGAAQGRP
jgi:hypothetical protein